MLWIVHLVSSVKAYEELKFVVNIVGGGLIYRTSLGGRFFRTVSSWRSISFTYFSNWKIFYVLSPLFQLSVLRNILFRTVWSILLSSPCLPVFILFCFFHSFVFLVSLVVLFVTCLLGMKKAENLHYLFRSQKSQFNRDARNLTSVYLLRFEKTMLFLRVQVNNFLQPTTTFQHIHQRTLMHWWKSPYSTSWHHTTR